MNKIPYTEFEQRVKELVSGNALGTDLDLLRQNLGWVVRMISELVEAQE